MFLKTLFVVDETPGLWLFSEIAYYEMEGRHVSKDKMKYKDIVRFTQVGGLIKAR